MGSDTSIEWTDATWNPIRGCSRISEGCRNCYAEAVAARFSGPGLAYEGLARMGPNGPRWTGEVRVVPEHVGDPLRWTRPRRVFANSMSDLFHERLAFEDIAVMFGVMAAAGPHTFQILTKRAERMLEFFQWLPAHYSGPRRVPAWVPPEVVEKIGNAPEVPWPLPNVWLGVSVEDQAAADERIPALLDTPAAVRFLSVEPQLDEVDLSSWLDRIDHCTTCVAENGPQKDDLCPACGVTGTLISTWGHDQAERLRNGERYKDVQVGPADDGPQLHWVIVGGESGHNSRPFDVEWARTIVRQCAEAGVPCFVKQLGAKPVRWADASPLTIRLKSKKGAAMEEWPEDLRVRQFPAPRAA